MKCLVISNCATASYVELLQALKPGWTVKGATNDVARRWSSREPNPAFLEFAHGADVYVGLELTDGYEGIVLDPRAERITIPAFVFRGLHPDCINLPAAGLSPLGDGQLHSRIVAICYLIGRSVAETIDRFDPETFQELGYFDAYDRDRRLLVNSYRAFGIDIRAEVSRWERTGKFVYTINHPAKFVLLDMLCAALRHRLLSETEIAAAAPLLAQVEDRLADLIVWPVYPEIGARRHIAEPLVWRTAQARGAKTFDLESFVAATFAQLRTMPALGLVDIRDFEGAAEALGVPKGASSAALAKV